MTLGARQRAEEEDEAEKEEETEEEEEEGSRVMSPVQARATGYCPPPKRRCRRRSCPVAGVDRSILFATGQLIVS